MNTIRTNAIKVYPLRISERILAADRRDIPVNRPKALWGLEEGKPAYWTAMKARGGDA